MKGRKVRTPLEEDIVKDLHVGERVLLSGVIYTARDAAHKRMAETLKRGENPPFDLRGQVIYYAGPAPAPPGVPIGSIGPTTSGRMDRYTPMLLEMGLKGMIGRGEGTRRSLPPSEQMGQYILGRRAVRQRFLPKG